MKLLQRILLAALAASFIERGAAFTPNSPFKQRRCQLTHSSAEAGRRSWRPLDRKGRTLTAGPLQASPLLTAAGSPLGSLAILAGIVLIHEAGHYLAARAFGIQVEEFSVGFGPKLLGFTAVGNEFNLRALPLGGYVKFPENYNTTEYQEKLDADMKAAEEFVSTQDLDFGSKLLNFLTFGAVEEKLWKQEKQRRASETGEKEQKKTRKPWWLFWGSATETQKAVATEEIEYYDDPDLLQNRPWQQRAVVLSAGVVFNLLLSWSIYFGQIGFGPGVPSPVFEQGAVVTSMPRPDAAANGILRQGDVILRVNGAPIGESRPSVFESQRAISEFIEKIRATPDGESLELTVRHPNKIEEEVKIAPKRMADQTSPKSIGVLLSPNFMNTELIKSDSLIETARLAYKYVAELTRETANGLMMFLVSLITGRGTGGNQVSGPVGLIRTGAEVVATQDWTAAALFAAAISINLGVVNALPLPALDGGQLMFVFAEALTGRKVDQRVQEGITGVAVFFLLLLSVTTFVGDLTALFAR